jgi:hypothetical protein
MSVDKKAKEKEKELACAGRLGPEQGEFGRFFRGYYRRRCHLRPMAEVNIRDYTAKGRPRSRAMAIDAAAAANHGGKSQKIYFAYRRRRLFAQSRQMAVFRAFFLMNRRPDLSDRSFNVRRHGIFCPNQNAEKKPKPKQTPAFGYKSALF